jgi:hypothetical protein
MFLKGSMFQTVPLPEVTEICGENREFCDTDWVLWSTYMYILLYGHNALWSMCMYILLFGHNVLWSTYMYILLYGHNALWSTRMYRVSQEE